MKICNLLLFSVCCITICPHYNGFASGNVVATLSRNAREFPLNLYNNFQSFLRKLKMLKDEKLTTLRKNRRQKTKKLLPLINWNSIYSSYPEHVNPLRRDLDTADTNIPHNRVAFKNPNIKKNNTSTTSKISTTTESLAKRQELQTKLEEQIRRKEEEDKIRAQEASLERRRELDAYLQDLDEREQMNYEFDQFDENPFVVNEREFSYENVDPFLSDYAYDPFLPNDEYEQNSFGDNHYDDFYYINPFETVCN